MPKSALDSLVDSESKPTIIMDGGIATHDNLLFLRENNYSYIVAGRHRNMKIPDNLKWEIVQEKKDNIVHASKVEQPETNEIHLYCHSQMRQKKEESMRDLLQGRLIKDLERAREALSKKGGTKAYPKVTERIGRLKQKHKAIASFFSIQIKADQEGNQAKDITWEIKEDKIDQRFQGSYFIKAYGFDGDAKKLWKTYTNS